MPTLCPSLMQPRLESAIPHQLPPGSWSVVDWYSTLPVCTYASSQHQEVSLTQSSEHTFS